jgi:Rieske Fe-S protein
VLVRAQGLGGAYLLVNTGTGYLALSGICPHAGCELTWVPEDREAECPCHGSRFAGDGTLLSPPARTDLTSFPVDPPDAQGRVAIRLFAGDGVFKEKVVAGKVTFPLAEFPALAKVGGAVVGRPDGFPGPLVVARLAESGPDAIGAISAVCSHLGCTVLPQACASSTACPTGTFLECPCHGSQFDLTGAFLQGPAGGGLFRYGVTVDGTTVTVSTTPRG